MIHELRGKLLLQTTRVDGLCRFEEKAGVKLATMPTKAWCRTEVETWKDYSNELGSGMDNLGMRVWEVEQELMRHRHCSHCEPDYNSSEVSGWEPRRFRTGSERSHSSFGTPEGLTIALSRNEEEQWTEEMWKGPSWRIRGSGIR